VGSAHGRGPAEHSQQQRAEYGVGGVGDVVDGGDACGTGLGEQVAQRAGDPGVVGVQHFGHPAGGA
jgi:hypothetical protein